MQDFNCSPYSFPHPHTATIVSYSVAEAIIQQQDSGNQTRRSSIHSKDDLVEDTHVLLLVTSRHLYL
jgi:hypothetical protein